MSEEEIRVRAGGLRERLAATLRTYASERDISLERLGELLGVSRSSVFNLTQLGRRSGTRSKPVPLPNLEALMRVCQLTGISADWLMGEAVAPRTDERGEAGDAAGAVRDLLARHAPAYAPLDEIASQAGRNARITNSQLISETAAAWWSKRLRKRARQYADAIKKLSVRVGDDAHSVSDRSLRQFLAKAADDIESICDDLRSPKLTWEDLHAYRPGKLFLSGSAEKENVMAMHYKGWIADIHGLGGGAVAWYERGGVDSIWFVDPESLEPAFVQGRDLSRPYG